MDRTSMVVLLASLPPAVPAFHVGTGSNPRCSTYNIQLPANALGKKKMPHGLHPHSKKQKLLALAWAQPSSGILAIWEVNQMVPSPSPCLSVTLSSKTNLKERKEKRE